MSKPERYKQVCPLLRADMPYKSIAKLLDISYRAVSGVAGVKPQRICLFADSHSGANTGLTPPAYQYKYIENPDIEEHRIRNKWAVLQRECWDWFVHTAERYKPFDKTFVLGDLIDGDGKRSGGTELITTDRKVQTCMATEALEVVRAPGMVFVFGTPYHTGQAEDYEVDIARHFDSKIGGHEWETINGCTFDLKHKQSNTKNPFTSLHNEIIDNREWAAVGEQPKADVIVRAHTHRFCFAKIEDCVAISMPSLQGYGTKFGARQCTRKVHFGLIILDVWPDGYVQEYINIAQLVSHRTRSN